MATKQVIQKQIESAVKGKYADWRIGLADDPLVRKSQLGNPLHWIHWEAESPGDARQVFDHFNQRGMVNDGIQSDQAKFVYITPLRS